MHYVIICIFCVYQTVAQDVIQCNGACECSSAPQEQSCTLRCNGKRSCENTVLICDNDDACIVKCNGEDSCSGSFIHCGAASCLIACHSRSSCDGTIIHADDVDFECTGNCDSLSTLSTPFRYQEAIQTTTESPTNTPTFTPTQKATKDAIIFPTNHNFVTQTLSLTATEAADIIGVRSTIEIYDYDNNGYNVQQFASNFSNVTLIKLSIAIVLMCACIYLCICLCKQLCCEPKKEKKKNRNNESGVINRNDIEGKITQNDSDLESATESTEEHNLDYRDDYLRKYSAGQI